MLVGLHFIDLKNITLIFSCEPLTPSGWNYSSKKINDEQTPSG